jgi:hypothetical protein
MKMGIPDWFALGVLALGIGAAACSTQTEQPPATETTRPAAPAPAVPPAVSINAVMVALIDHAAHELWNVEKTAPKDDNGWRAVEHHAIQLAAAGPVLVAGGTGERDRAWAATPTWAAHARRQTDAATAAIDAARSKNVESLTVANGRLLEACEACHKEFKPDLPTEGITHPHEH